MAEWLNGRALCLAKAHLYPTTLQCIKLHHLSKACASDTCLVFSAATHTHFLLSLNLADTEVKLMLGTSRESVVGSLTLD